MNEREWAFLTGSGFVLARNLLLKELFYGSSLKEMFTEILDSLFFGICVSHYCHLVHLRLSNFS